MLNFKIVTDSSSSVFKMGDVPFSSAPLKIRTAEKEFVDNEKLNVLEMVEHLISYKGRSSSSCPNTEDWLNSFGDAENIFCITISATLSGGYNSACVAKEIYEETHPDRRVFVMNSLSTGPEMILIMEKVAELYKAGASFDEICEGAVKYSKKCALFFVLESMKNLANNGRVSALAAKAAGLLGIRALGKASDGGELQMLDKCRGESKTLQTIILRLREHGFKKGKIIIAHCANLPLAQELKNLIQTEFGKVKVEISKCGGLCSFYAEKGGLIIGFEKC